MHIPMVRKLMHAWFWEYIQNTPLILAFTYGFAQFSEGDMVGAGRAILSGVIAGALLIRITESRIEGGEVESWRETATNIFFFSLAISFFIFYFSRTKQILHIDILSGIFTGILASVFQAFAARSWPTIRHTVSLAAAFAAAVWLIRTFALTQSPLPGALTINLAVTTVIVLIEYRGASSRSNGAEDNPHQGNLPNNAS